MKPEFTYVKESIAHNIVLGYSVKVLLMLAYHEVVSLKAYMKPFWARLVVVKVLSYE